MRQTLLVKQRRIVLLQRNSICWFGIYNGLLTDPIWIASLEYVRREGIQNNWKLSIVLTVRVLILYPFDGPVPWKIVRVLGHLVVPHADDHAVLDDAGADLGDGIFAFLGSQVGDGHEDVVPFLPRGTCCSGNKNNLYTGCFLSTSIYSGVGSLVKILCIFSLNFCTFQIFFG